MVEKLNHKKSAAKLQSMTGSAFVTSNFHDLSVTIALKSLNHKSFKLILNTTPESISIYEPDFERVVKRKISRGIVFCSVDVEESNPVETFLDVKLLEKCFEKLNHLRKRFKIDEEIEMETVLDLYFRLAKKNNKKEFALMRDKIFITLNKALNELVESRRREGKKMRSEIVRLLNKLHKNIKRLNNLRSKIASEYRRNLIAKTTELLKNYSVKKFSEEDIIKEVAYYVERSDINEEIKRLEAHSKESLRVIKKGGAVGRKMEFIFQEMRREATTLSNKAQNYSISKIAVNTKLLIDQMREIVQNLE